VLGSVLSILFVCKLVIVGVQYRQQQQERFTVEHVHALTEHAKVLLLVWPMTYVLLAQKGISLKLKYTGRQYASPAQLVGFLLLGVCHVMPVLLDLVRHLLKFLTVKITWGANSVLEASTQRSQ